ncbi:3'-5' exonuclease [Paraferrimonas sedimenticola]|uniref:DNA-directed DNA polymerase n=1 Tax=Paraferrimonas sedimenticola TaxID=375674 RepID=A0AA37VTW9_9GAMM|nr:3'-5' exonuclease [Paraferrimonas sedimenticola]GLP95441.1 DNA polymerase III subunit epsilon [Paraferrimonas sedimenticola]
MLLEPTPVEIAADTIVVLDFETTGLSPDRGDRAIEIGAVKLVKGEIVESFQELMNPGMRISRFIEDYTGISNSMLTDAAPCEEVMHRFADFIGDFNLLAHNASFDRKFLDAEFARIGHSYSGSFGCSLLTSRRVFQDAPNHKLGTLVEYKQLPTEGVFHRALADAQMTAYLWLELLSDIKRRTELDTLSFEQLSKLSTVPKRQIEDYLQRLAQF